MEMIGLMYMSFTGNPISGEFVPRPEDVLQSTLKPTAKTSLVETRFIFILWIAVFWLIFSSKSLRFIHH
jgi:hypothetical protein